MQRPFRLLLAVSVSAASLSCVAFGLRAAEYAPRIDPASFAEAVDNPYFPLVPGTITRFVERAGGETTQREVTVTSERRIVMGVHCVVVHDVATEQGSVVEDTFDWFAQDAQGNVWYFGEATREFGSDGAVSSEGSWEAGVGGAQPGIVMPAKPEPGDPFRQEYLLGVAEDMAQVTALDRSATVPAGTFDGCVETRDWSLLEAGSEKKWYAKGVGFVRAESLSGEVEELVSVARH